MRLHELGPLKGAKRNRKRIGRGESSGQGKTAGRGHKGQKARSGGGTRPGFEGGQMPLQRRLPKRGFTNIFKKVYQLVSLEDLNFFEDDQNLSPLDLLNQGLIKDPLAPIKLLANGDLTKKLNLTVQAASKAALEKVTALGGQLTLGPLSPEIKENIVKFRSQYPDDLEVHLVGPDGTMT
jgi:large subunit ribosomal protein L15